MSDSSGIKSEFETHLMNMVSINTMIPAQSLGKMIIKREFADVLIKPMNALIQVNHIYRK